MEGERGGEGEGERKRVSQCGREERVREYEGEERERVRDVEGWSGKSEWERHTRNKGKVNE
jgi:hypothetical protein